jgi:hypothetical protein
MKKPKDKNKRKLKKKRKMTEVRRRVIRFGKSVGVRVF